MSGDQLSAPGRGRLREVALLFARLGATAFGGPAAHIALMEDEVVRRRAWLTRPEFLDLVGATNLIPGPNSTEMAIHLGFRRAGWPGLLVGGACFILPAVAVTLALAWGYVRFGALPASAAVLYGVKPVIVAVVAQALVGLSRSAVKTPRLAALGVIAAAGAIAGANQLLVLVGAGALGVALRRPRAAPALLWPVVGGGGVAAAAPAVALLPLFLFFLKVGAVLFGSGYVLLAFLRADLVQRLHWLTEAQLLDAVAAGQLTPGPVFSTATFIGYVIAGGRGAALATVGIFLPSFVFVALSGPLIPRLRRSAVAGAFLDGVNVASLALMAVVAVTLGRAAIVDVKTALLAAAAALLLLRFRVNSALLVLGGASVGLAAWLAR